MKTKRFTSIIYFLLTIGVHGAIPAAENPQPWWQVDFFFSIKGSYQPLPSNPNRPEPDRFQFDIHQSASMEQDSSGDYILYPGEKKISNLAWIKNSKPTEEIQPDILLNYVLKENGVLTFDFEIMLTPQTLANFPELSTLKLPRSALNKLIHPKDKYNKGVKKGSNKIRLKEKLFIKTGSAEKRFTWSYERKKAGLLSTHQVELTLKIARGDSAACFLKVL